MEENIKFAIGYGKSSNNYFIRIHCNYPFIGKDKMGCSLYLSNADSKSVIEHLKKYMYTLNDENSKHFDVCFVADEGRLVNKTPENELIEKIYKEVKETIYKAISQTLYERKFEEGFNLEQDNENFKWNN